MQCRLKPMLCARHFDRSATAFTRQAHHLLTTSSTKKEEGISNSRASASAAMEKQKQTGDGVVADGDRKGALPKPTCSLVGPLLTDMYQVTMAYAYWKQGKQDDAAIFDLYFRKNPFKGEFVIFAGVDEVLKYLAHFHVTDEDIDYLRTQLPHADPGFFTWLGGLDCSEVKVYGLRNGAVCFARVPLLRVEGPLGITQLLETTLLNLVNYASLIATNAARHRLAVGPDKVLFEFGLRRAQGPDGAVSASKYSYIGGFDGTSNVLAGKLTGIKISGTHAHAFVQSYRSLEELVSPMLDGVDIVQKALEYRTALGYTRSNLGELAAFIAYAQSFPDNLLCLVDTYDTLKSGVANFICVGLAISDLGHKPIGVRLDSGDLAYLSKRTRQMFQHAAEKYNRPYFANLNIVASNDINEQVLYALAKQGHTIDTFGVGTNLVTCQAQPALGCVYKLVEINGHPRIKLSQDIGKVTMPCRKNVYRLYTAHGEALNDIITMEGEPAPVPGERLMCRHPFDPMKRAYVTPAAVKEILSCVWDGKNGGVQDGMLVSLEESRKLAQAELKTIREDVLREVNPTPYKVSISPKLFEFFHSLWEDELPVTEIS